MEVYNIHSSFIPIGTYARCDIRGCSFPGLGFTIIDHWHGWTEDTWLCLTHFRTRGAPFSLEYEDADALLGVPRHKHAAYCKDGYLKALPDSWWSGIGRGRIRGYVKRPTIKTGANKKDWARIECERRQRDEDWATFLRELEDSKTQDETVTHSLDPIYNAFDKTKDQLFRYTLCGEKVLLTRVAKDGEPTCESCKRIAMYERVLAHNQEAPKPKPVILTPPKPTEHTPEFEELLLNGLLNQSAFENRRNWGERSGRAWNDPSQGVQRDSRLRLDRGGVNRKRG